MSANGEHIKLLACILVTASTIRGPLFQQASTVNRALQQISGHIELQVAQLIPNAYVRSDAWFYQPTLGPELVQVLEDLIGGANYTLKDTRCGGVCTALVKVGHRTHWVEFDLLRI